MEQTRIITQCGTKQEAIRLSVYGLLQRFFEGNNDDTTADVGETS